MEIESLSYHGGRGVGRHEGVVVFVPFTAPGDRALVTIVEVNDRFLLAEATRILRPSPHRRQAPCPVFERCGGCGWQHVAYAEQARQKQAILEASLRQLSRTQSFEILPLLLAPDEFGYRNRIQIQKDGTNVGFFARKTREIVPTSACLIAEQEISSVIAGLADGRDGRYEIHRRRDGTVAAEWGRRAPETALFSQVNSRQNARLIETILKWAGGFRFRRIWDLYCGSGNLTLPLAAAFPACDVHGVELSRDAIALAQSLNAKVQWRSGDVGHFLSTQQEAKDTLAVFDPPRAGLEGAVVDHIRRLQPPILLAVSCNPMTFSRDAQKLIANGYRLQRVQGLDMFPQTEHVELIGLLVLR